MPIFSFRKTNPHKNEILLIRKPEKAKKKKNPPMLKRAIRPVQSELNKLIIIDIQGADPKMIANNLESAYPTHPGLILKDGIEYRGISQRRLAEQKGIGYSVLSEIPSARRPKRSVVYAAVG